jgi:hypothetical protein
MRPECRRHEPSLEPAGAGRRVRCPVVSGPERPASDDGRG